MRQVSPIVGSVAKLGGKHGREGPGKYIKQLTSVFAFLTAGRKWSSLNGFSKSRAGATEERGKEQIPTLLEQWP